jgi:hypothetical protein
MEEPNTTLGLSISGPERVGATLVELIIAATECSEDEYEVADLVDAALASGCVELTPVTEYRTSSHIEWGHTTERPPCVRVGDPERALEIAI